MSDERRAKVRALARDNAKHARKMVEDLDERSEATEIERALVIAVRLLSRALERMADLSEVQDRERKGEVAGC